MGQRLASKVFHQKLIFIALDIPLDTPNPEDIAKKKIHEMKCGDLIRAGFKEGEIVIYDGSSMRIIGFEMDGWNTNLVVRVCNRFGYSPKMTPSIISQRDFGRVILP